MNNVTPLQFWLRRATYIALGILILLQTLIPLDLNANHIPGPDILYTLTIAYIIRRPEYVPLWSLVFVFFMRDVLTMAPLGLGTLAMVAASELVRNNLQAFREYFFSIEWLWVSVIFAGMLVLQKVLLTLSISSSPSFVDMLIELLFTMLAYPVTVALMRYGFGIERPAAGKTDAWGHRI